MNFKIKIIPLIISIDSNFLRKVSEQNWINCVIWIRKKQAVIACPCDRERNIRDN